MTSKTKSRILRKLLVFFALVSITGLVVAVIIHRPRPQLVQSPEADAFARKIMRAVGDPEWRRMNRVVFRFAGEQYEWRVQKNTVIIGKDDQRVELDLGTSSCQNSEGSGTVSAAHCEYLKVRWYNESYWLHPFGKLFDPGTERGLCVIEEASPPWLCIQFNQGGLTPGDLFAIKVGDSGRPVAWRMWVRVSPVGGIHTAWSNWKEHQDGVWYAQKRSVLGFPIPVDLISVE